MKAQVFSDVETACTTASATSQGTVGQPCETVAAQQQETAIMQYSRERKGAQYAFDNSIVTMVTMDKMENPEVRERYMRMIEARNAHDMEIEDRAFEREESRADRKLDADIKLRNKSLVLVFVLYLAIVIGFSCAVMNGASAECLLAFGVFFAAGGIAIFLRFFRWDSSKPRHNR